MPCRIPQVRWIDGGLLRLVEMQHLDTMETMKIVLVRPNYKSHIITPPLGLGYLASFLKSHGIEAIRLHKVHEKKKPNILDYITERKIDFVISIPDPERKSALDSDYALRRTAVDFSIPLLTNLQIAELFALALTTKKPADLHIKHWAEYE